MFAPSGEVTVPLRPSPQSKVALRIDDEGSGAPL
jgi:hypothetical protein